jgi:hypothetical protein
VVDDDTETALAATKRIVFGIMMGLWDLQGFTTWRLRTVSA